MPESPVKIAYWVFNYAPQWEAASREIRTLISNFETQFDTQLISQNFSSKKIRITGKHKSFPLPYSLIALPFLPRIASSYQINHIFASAGESILLPRISRQNALLTITKDTDSLNAFEKNIPHLESLKYIVVESERHREILLQVGINPKAVKLIYPGASIKAYQPASDPFTILFATSPLGEHNFLSRGIYLMLQAAARLPEVRFIFAWREHNVEKMHALLDQHQAANVKVLNGYIPNMDQVYQSVHATILPGLSYSSLKPSPHSALDSLAHGKPILISRPSSISGLAAREKCGVVFEPHINCLVEGIQELRENYDLYQRNCHRVIRECFSETTFIEGYREIYESML